MHKILSETDVYFLILSSNIDIFLSFSHNVVVQQQCYIINNALAVSSPSIGDVPSLRLFTLMGTE